tara:strand:- start:70 stop:675 length:606 start_codon:yes stop_codon:yes gene_type:complete
MSIIKLNNNALSGLTSFTGSASLGDMVFISSATASGSASIEFTSGIDSTYKEYKFFFINMHPATDNVAFTVNFRDGDTNFDATKTTSAFYAYNEEAGGSQYALTYFSSIDLAQSTGDQTLNTSLGSDNDQSLSGTMNLFNPASTTFVKHFTANTQIAQKADFTQNVYVGGYCNVTAAIDGVKFAMSSGNIDSGKILLFGLN